MNIRQEVQQELSRGNVDKEIINLALAAFHGVEEIDRALAGEVAETSEVVSDNEGQVSPVYLQDITVSGFRGIGPETKLEIPPGPGLTVVVGRNGSGKSSFSEGLEVLLTGDSYRWKGKTMLWKKGWRNMHQGDNPKITARFQVEGMNRQTIVERKWNHSSKMEESECFAQHHGQSRSNLAGIGWKGSLDLYRPILSYNELSMIEDSPSALYDILSKVLGLENLSDAIKSLAEARLSRQRDGKSITKQLEEDFVPTLDRFEDERAKKVSVALSKPQWDLENIKIIIDSREPDSSYKDLRDLINISIPDEEQVTRVANKMKEACTSLTNLSGTEAEQAGKLVVLLKKSLEHYETHYNQACPVCGVGVLDDDWYTDVLEQIKDLEDTAQSYRKAKKNIDSALEEARQIVSIPNLAGSDVVDTKELISVWNKWSLLPDNKNSVSEHLLSQYSVVRDKVAKVSEQARQIFSDREDKWNAFLPELRNWFSKAHKVIEEKREIAEIKQAEKSVKNIMSNLRSIRWSPIESQALDLWKDLRLESNINLRSVELAGSRTTRKVDLQVEVDDIKADALSVVSQGELSCLALSLFFPRAMLSASPFRFLMIDDPVQAMDPARVDGLARVFAKIAKERQLIVFTHDNRLPESLRLLNLEHHCLEVIRLPDSVVKVEEKRDPIKQYFFDARSVMKDENLQSEMAKQVIPGFCRSGLEAACVEAIWRRRLGVGKSHEIIEEELSNAKKLSQKASLVFFDKIDQGGKVYKKISDKWKKGLADAYNASNRGTHNKYFGNLSALIKDCQSLAELLRRYNV